MKGDKKGPVSRRPKGGPLLAPKPYESSVNQREYCREGEIICWIFKIIEVSFRINAEQSVGRNLGERVKSRQFTFRRLREVRVTGEDLHGAFYHFFFLFFKVRLQEVCQKKKIQNSVVMFDDGVLVIVVDVFGRWFVR